MRARICSASSCDMFARVVWLKPWGVAKLPIFTLSFAAHTCHAWLARLTRARGKSSQREGNALFDDFWYFSSVKSTIREKVSFCLFSGYREIKQRKTTSTHPPHKEKPRSARFFFVYFLCILLILSASRRLLRIPQGRLSAVLR